MSFIGTKDSQTVLAGGARAKPAQIAGVHIHELGNVITRSGYLTEIFRADWSVVGISVRQILWIQLNPGAVTDWHVHAKQTDHLVGVGGNIKLALWDARDGSSSKGTTEIIRFGSVRPILVIVPPGVWHGLRNESGEPAGYVNVTDEAFDHENPDNWRLSPHSTDIPDIL